MIFLCVGINYVKSMFIIRSKSKIYAQCFSFYYYRICVRRPFSFRILCTFLALIFKHIVKGSIVNFSKTMTCAVVYDLYAAIINTRTIFHSVFVIFSLIAFRNCLV